VGIATAPVGAGTAPPILVEQAKLTAIADGSGDSPAFDCYGSAVALEGDVLAVGAPFDDVLGKSDAGSVYAHQRSGARWTLQQKRTASEPEQAARFGFSVSLSGETLAVGAPRPFYQSAVYVFVRVGGVWQPQHRFEGGFEDAFGASVALVGNTLVVGAPSSDLVPTFGVADVFVRSGGSALVFDRTGTTWTCGSESSPPTDRRAIPSGMASALEGCKVAGPPGGRS
jgi:hypothetical protein